MDQNGMKEGGLMTEKKKEKGRKERLQEVMTC